MYANFRVCYISFVLRCIWLLCRLFWQYKLTLFVTHACTHYALFGLYVARRVGPYIIWYDYCHAHCTLVGLWIFSCMSKCSVVSLVTFRCLCIRMTLPKTLLSPLATKDMFLFALSGMNFSEISLGVTNNFCCHYCDKRNQILRLIPDSEICFRFL